MNRREETIRIYLKERFANYEDSVGFSDPLEGIVDSLGLFELVEFLEGEFSIHIPNEEFSPELFSTIERILQVVDEFKR